MSADSKKRTIIKVLIVIFTILALTGFGLILQTFLRQSGEKKQTQQRITDLKEQIAKEQTQLEKLQKKEDVLTVQIKQKVEKKQNPAVTVQEGLDTLPELQAQVENYLQEQSGTWSVYIKNLSTQEAMLYNTQPLKSASLMKLYIMGAVYDQIEQGNLEKNQEIINLLNNMITVSDNDAANQLTEYLGGDAGFENGAMIVNNYIVANNYSDTFFAHDFQAERSELPEKENMTSALDCGRFLENIYKNAVVSQEASQEMLGLLKQQQRRNKIPAGLREDAVCANKTGEVTGTENDVAIVYGSNGINYVICILSQDVDNINAQNVIKELSAQVYDYFVGTE